MQYHGIPQSTGERPSGNSRQRDSRSQSPQQETRSQPSQQDDHIPLSDACQGWSQDTERDVETHDWEDRPLFEDESDASSEDGQNEPTSNGMESHPNCHMEGVILGVSTKIWQ